MKIWATMDKIIQQTGMGKGRGELYLEHQQQNSKTEGIN